VSAAYDAAERSDLFVASAGATAALNAWVLMTEILR
jgi:hypothetical protein